MNSEQHFVLLRLLASDSHRSWTEIVSRYFDVNPEDANSRYSVSFKEPLTVGRKRPPALDTLYHEARRKYRERFGGSSHASEDLSSSHEYVLTPLEIELMNPDSLPAAAAAGSASIANIPPPPQERSTMSLGDISNNDPVSPPSRLAQSTLTPAAQPEASTSQKDKKRSASALSSPTRTDTENPGASVAASVKRPRANSTKPRPSGGVLSQYNVDNEYAGLDLAGSIVDVVEPYATSDDDPFGVAHADQSRGAMADGDIDAYEDVSGTTGLVSVRDLPIEVMPRRMHAENF